MQKANVAYMSRMKRQEALAGYLFLAPIVALMAVFVVYGVVFVANVSLHKWDGVDPSMMEWRGLRNFELLFTDPVFYNSLFNVLVFMVLTVTVQLFVGLLVGVIEQMAASYISPKSSDIIIYVLLLLILMIRPWGLFGQRELGRV